MGIGKESKANKTTEVATKYVKWFESLTPDDASTVGGKNASLGEMYRELTPLGVRVPNGFAVHIDAYRDSLTKEDIEEMHTLLDPLNEADHKDVARGAKAAARCREIVYNRPLPAAAEAEIVEAYRELKRQHGDQMSVAVRSSATAEDLPTASFAGQHDTYLHVEGEQNLLDAVKRCNASLFTERAVSYRMDKGFDHFKVFLSAGVMLMIRSDKAAAGVMFSIDTETGYRDAVFVTGAYGLGENVVQGAVEPDEWYVHKPTYAVNKRIPLRRRVGAKKTKMIYTSDRGSREPVMNVPTPPEDCRRLCISDEQVMELGGAAIKIEEHYGMPMDMEWALDGLDGLLYIVQARPETVVSQKPVGQLNRFTIGDTSAATVVATGRAVGSKIATGRARLIRSEAELSSFEEGEILVSDSTNPDWEPVMSRAAGIVTNQGGRTCHAAIVARELGIAAVIGCSTATSNIADGTMLTLSCAEGETGKVYDAVVPFKTKTVDLGQLKPPKTAMMVILGNPEIAFETSFLPAAGVGLARMEFILNKLGVHPMALLHPERLDNPDDVAAIAKLTENFDSGAEYFVRQLAEGFATIAGAFYPRPVVVRMSDFKSNEYASLLGGRVFEPVESNPMIGWRGASRYVHPSYVEAFQLECEAVRRCIFDMGLTNLTPMIPFCRTISEAQGVLDIMAKNGLECGSGAHGLEVYVMCEIPNNVVSIDAFSEHFDGFSIGSNDLTQLTLGCDRDSELVAKDFDERDPGILSMLKQAVEGCKRNGRHSGICGQAPSDYPEIAEFLVKLGIDSISLTPDTLLDTMDTISKLESELGR